MIVWAQYVLVPIGALLLLSYLGWCLTPVRAQGRRLTGWEDAGLVVAFLSSQAFLSGGPLYQPENLLLVVYGAILIPLLATVIARTTRPFLIAGLSALIYGEPLFRLCARAGLVGHSFGDFVAASFAYGMVSLVTMLFVVPIHHALGTKHSVSESDLTMNRTPV